MRAVDEVPKRQPEGRPIAAATVLLLSWGCVAAAVVLELWHRVLPPQDVPFYTNMTVHLFSLVAAVVVGAASAVVLAASRHPVGWLFAVVALGYAIPALGMMVTLITYDSPWTGLGLLGQGVAWLSAPATFAALTVLPWYLTTTPWPRLPRYGIALGWTCTAVLTFGVVTDEQASIGANPLSVQATWLSEVLDVVLPVTVAVGLGGALVALGVLIRQWRASPRGSRGRRGQGALAIAFALIVTPFVIAQYLPTDNGVLDILGMLSTFAGVLLFPFAVSVAVLRSWERPLQVAFPRVIVWLLLSTVVVAVYVLMVAAMDAVLPAADRYGRLLAVAVLALGAQPVRTWLQRRIDRLVYGSGSDPVSFLARMGEQLRGGGSEGGALPALAGSLRRGLRLDAVEVVADGDPPVHVRAGTEVVAATGDALTVPLVLEGTRIGELRLHPAPGQRLDQRARRVVGYVTELMAVSLNLAQTNQRLRLASERLGQVRDEERRMLRRELHDGMGPALAGVGLGVAAARRKLRHDPAGAERLLAELESELARRTDDVRLLARSILPAQLDDGDLAQALEVLAERFRSAGMTVRTHVEVDVDLDTRHQIAIYHVATEALMNAYRHADADTVEIAVSALADGGVALEVIDDGCGISDAATAGVGLRSMRERAEELGGQVSVDQRRAQPGTRVRMVVP